MSDHAVIVRFDYGQTDLSPLFELEDQLSQQSSPPMRASLMATKSRQTAATARSTCMGQMQTVFEVVRPVLAAATCIRNAIATIRYGPPEDGVKEREVAIDA